MSARIGARISEQEALALIRALLSSAGAGLHPDHVALSPGGPAVTPAPPAPGYRAPEQQGEPTVQGDIYIAGTLLYELLSGQRLGALPGREILHASALRRALDPLEIDPGTRRLLGIMLDFRPEARLDPAMLAAEVDELLALLGPAPAPPDPPGTPDLRSAGAPDLRSAGTPDLRSAGTPDLRSAGTPDLRSAGTPDLRSAGTPGALARYGGVILGALLLCGAVAVCGGGSLLAVWVMYR